MQNGATTNNDPINDRLRTFLVVVCVSLWGILANFPSAAVTRVHRTPLSKVSTAQHQMQAPLRFTSNSGRNLQRVEIVNPCNDDAEFKFGKNSLSAKSSIKVCVVSSIIDCLILGMFLLRFSFEYSICLWIKINEETLFDYHLLTIWPNSPDIFHARWIKQSHNHRTSIRVIISFSCKYISGEAGERSEPARRAELGEAGYKTSFLGILACMQKKISRRPPQGVMRSGRHVASLKMRFSEDVKNWMLNCGQKTLQKVTFREITALFCAQPWTLTFQVCRIMSNVVDIRWFHQFLSKDAES